MVDHGSDEYSREMRFGVMESEVRRMRKDVDETMKHLRSEQIAATEARLKEAQALERLAGVVALVEQRLADHITRHNEGRSWAQAAFTTLLPHAITAATILIGMYYALGAQS